MLSEGSQREVAGNPYRPTAHFSSSLGPLRDLEGIVHASGSYRLFFRYVAGAEDGGELRRAQAVSPDLIHWREYPIRIQSDSIRPLGPWSIVSDPGGLTELVGESQQVLLAYFHYTEAGEDGQFAEPCLGAAFSTDQGLNWRTYEGNPLFRGIQGEKPRVVRFPKDSLWVLTTLDGPGREVGFYTSRNGKEWEQVRGFGLRSYPDTFEPTRAELLPLEVNGEKKAYGLLTLDLGKGAANGGSGTLSVLGHFDGTGFTPVEEWSHWLDQGTDAYSGVFLPRDSVAQILWLSLMNNAVYQGKTPMNSLGNTLNWPRHLSLAPVEAHPTLKSVPVVPPENMSRLLWEQSSLDPGSEVLIRLEQLSPSRLNFRTQSREFRVVFRNGVGEQVVVYTAPQNDALLVDRMFSGQTTFEPEFGNKKQYIALERPGVQEQEFVIFLDRSSVEVFTGDGAIGVSILCFPNEPFDELRISNGPLGQKPLKEMLLKSLPLNLADSLEQRSLLEK